MVINPYMAIHHIQCPTGTQNMGYGYIYWLWWPYTVYRMIPYPYGAQPYACPRLPFLSFSLPWKAEFFCPREKVNETNDETQARMYGFQNGTQLRLLTYDPILLTEDEWKVAHAQ